MNITNTENKSFYCQYETPDTYTEKMTKITIYTTLSVLGILGNALVILLAVKYSLRKNQHLVINLALADGIFLVALLMNSLSWISDGKVSIFSNNGLTFVVVCEMNTFFLQASHKVSLITLLVISIERFRSTRRRLKRSRQFSKKRQLAVVGACWLLVAPITIVFGYFDGSCSVPTKPIRLWGSLDFIASVICCVICILSIVTIRRLSKSRAIHANLNDEQKASRTRRSRAAVRMVLVSVLLFMLCWLPLFVYRSIFSLQKVFRVKIIDFRSCLDWSWFSFIVFYFLPVFNSFFSPFVYMLFLTDFRQAARTFFLCRRLQSRVNPSDLNTTQQS